MPEFTLLPHPDFPYPTGISLEVYVERSGGGLELIYWLGGGDSVKIADRGNGGRSGGLWKYTCFEAFVRLEGKAGYTELNFSPRGEWAAYAFNGRRQGMCDLTEAAGPVISPGYRAPRENDDYGWSYSTADIFDPAVDWHLNLSAVIEATDGTKSYWALAHAPGPPDFHNPDCFIATLPAPAAA